MSSTPAACHATNGHAPAHPQQAKPWTHRRAWNELLTDEERRDALACFWKETAHHGKQANQAYALNALSRYLHARHGTLAKKPIDEKAALLLSHPAVINKLAAHDLLIEEYLTFKHRETLIQVDVAVNDLSLTDPPEQWYAAVAPLITPSVRPQLVAAAVLVTVDESDVSPETITDIVERILAPASSATPPPPPGVSITRNSA